MLAMTATDTLGRPLRDLRISVTDRCNFRCVYCMPREVFGRDYEFVERAELLTFEEIERLARIFVGDHGVSKIRLTGGEPLVRREVERLVEMLARDPGLRDPAMTTNGPALARKGPAPGGRRRGGAGADKDQHGRQGWLQRGRGGADGPPLPWQRPHRALHRVHGRRPQQRLADGRGGAGGGDRRADRRRAAARAGRAELPRGGRRAP